MPDQVDGNPVQPDKQKNSPGCAFWFIGGVVLVLFVMWALGISVLTLLQAVYMEFTT